MGRDDFSEPTKRAIAERASYFCTICRSLTLQPHSQPGKSYKTGVTAHIRAASPEGPRFDHTQSQEARKSHDNGIWLCGTCSIEIDRDVSRYSVERLIEIRAKHWDWLKSDPSIPKAPIIQLHPLPGLPLRGICVTEELSNRLRAFKLNIYNTNSTIIHDIHIRFQLPEPIVTIADYQIPPGSPASFRPETFDFCSTAANGGFAFVSEQMAPTPIWTLEIGSLSPQKNVCFTIITEENGAPFPPDSEDYLTNFGSGNFQHDFLGERITREIFVPIFFDRPNRLISSGETQNGQGEWKTVLKQKII